MGEQRRPGVGEAARLLDDMTQQMVAVPPLLDAPERDEAPLAPAPPPALDGHAL
ncbi:hypothetical protein GCM10017786_42550 [Amycolatopsis deserti]|uniref:Uncharacterized protein n=1 Tax=Amycolatopsis deserti TaxID=185696 RepID=A0ABQ3J698_9PSEU|nr:hypothetical protein [Amycolatopsis deserti]GHF04226.1 hypothetical protein GCM10017786_42550 [Amycolatopsis deserti]